MEADGLNGLTALSEWLPWWAEVSAWQVSAEQVSLVFLLALNLYVLIEVWLNRLQTQHIAQHREQVPAQFAASVSLEQHQKAADYAQVNLQLGRWVLVLDALVLLFLTLGGGFQSIYETVSAYSGLGDIWLEIVFMLSVVIGLSVLHLPLSLYSTFGIEARFGFNKTTPMRFIADLLKSMALLLVLGVPLLWVMLTIIYTFIDEAWWLYAWAAWMGFSVFLLWAYPTWIAPLFNRFTPLADGKVKERVEALLQRTGFDHNGIFVMDGSSRSGHGNAYFTGLGKHKRIVFFDTLLEKLSPTEVEAVLAHELGHFKHGHIRKRLIKSSLMTLIGFALLAWLMTQPAFYTGLGVEAQTPAMTLLLFMMALPTLFFWLSPLAAYSSRRDEFQADAFAVQHSSAEALTSALVGLYRDNAASLTPHPWYSAYHDSHPPATLRIAALNGVSQ